jgi:hypothetical protein
MNLDLTSFSDAKAAGLRRYYTGKPCAQGHVAERFVSTRGCSICAANSAIAWKKANPERMRARSAEWIRRNPEKYKELKAAWAKAHPEHQAKRARNWFLKNREKADAASLAWRKNNPGKHAAYAARCRAELVQRTPKWADLKRIDEIYEQANAQRQAGELVEVDHEIPLRGKRVTGLHVHDNLRIIHMTLNRAKSNHFLET